MAPANPDASDAIRAAARRVGQGLPPRAYVIFYDARCQICRTIRHLLERLQADAPLLFVDINDPQAMADWPYIDPQLARCEVSVIDPTGAVSTGYTASAVLVMAALPRTRPLRPLLLSPPMRRIGPTLYHLVSDRRYALSRILFPIRERRLERQAHPDRQESSAMPEKMPEKMPEHMPQQEADSPHVIEAALAGALAGLAGAWTMNQFHAMVSRFSQTSQSVNEEEQETDAQRGQEMQQQEPATVKTAKLITQRVLDYPLSAEEKRVAGPAVHYGFGATVGALYGVLAELTPAVTSGQGTLYGAAVWAVADEAAVPAAGLSAPPAEHPASTHLTSLGAHLVYGVTLETLRQGLRWLRRG